MIVYVFGLEEHVYDGGTSNTFYYSLGGCLIGELSSAGTQFILTDPLGSITASFSDVAGSASIIGNQSYGPYGNKLYSAGSTAQYSDSVTEGMGNVFTPLF